MTLLRRRNKYGAKKTEVDGVIFSSKKEAERYLRLKFLQSIGYISGLRFQVPYNLYVNSNFICKYIADFVYFEGSNKDLIVEDVKGVKTPTYNIKKKLMKALHGIDIRET